METEKTVQKKPMPGTDICRFNPLTHDCDGCIDMNECRAYQKQFSKLPHFIVDVILWRLKSPSSIKVFLFLNRKALHKKGDPNNGRCRFTYKQIEEATGVKTDKMRIYMKQLKKSGLIDFAWKRTATSEGEFKTIHEFTVKWIKQLDDYDD